MHSLFIPIRDTPSGSSADSSVVSNDLNHPSTVQFTHFYSQHSRPGLSPLGSASMLPFNPHRDMGSLSPQETNSYLGDNLRASGGASGTPSPAQISAMMMHNPKRAYRQRRKDPSCDACRERKVKVILRTRSKTKSQADDYVVRCDRDN